jgi:hypothetical protein
MHVCKDNAKKAETKKIENSPAAGPRCVNDIDGYAKPDQYDRGIRRLRHCPAGASGRQTFLIRQRSKTFPDEAPISDRQTATS